MANYNHRPLPPISEKDITRFHPLIDKTPGFGPKGECWKWIGGRNNYGYGRFWLSIGKRMWQAHVISYFLHTGEDPYPLQCLHECDNKTCVNPAHLHIGDRSMNLQEAYDRGYMPKGDDHWARKRLRAHPMAKVNEHQVREIRALKEAGNSTLQISKKFSISTVQVNNIAKRKSWGHIP